MRFQEKFNEELAVFEREISRASDSVYGVLISHLYVEHLLDRYLKAKIPKDAGLFGKDGLSFKHKLQLVDSFGEVDSQLIDALSKLNSIRNSCAHSFGYQVKEEIVKNLGRTLGKNYKRIMADYPNAEIGGLAPILWNICGQALSITLHGEGYR